MKKLFLTVLVVLLLASSTLMYLPAARAQSSSPIIEWKGWSIGIYYETVGFIGDTISANLRMSDEPPGHYRIRIMRDVELWPDQETATTEFDYYGGDNTYALSFIPITPTGQDGTNGYHVDVYNQEWLGWAEKWTMPNDYPPRLRIIGWSTYHSYNEIESGLRSLERGIAKVQSIGVSVEGRQIWAIKISDNPSVDDQNKPDILFVGCHHAREWISAEVPLYLAANLVQKYASDSNVKAVVDNSEIWIVPVLNPDGLEHTRNGGIDFEVTQPQYLYQARYWRKNMQVNSDGSHGVDLNRNYGSGSWGMDVIPNDIRDGSPNPHDDTYWGPSPFSEPETRAIRDLVLDANKQFQSVLSYHSYGQYVIYPWNYEEEPAEDSSIMNVLAEGMVDQIRNVHGVSYTSGQGSTVPGLYKTTGDLTDWVYETKHIPALTIELRPNQDDIWELLGFGFDLSTDQILPTCEENWPAAVYLMRWVVLSQGGFMDFENGVDQLPIRSTIPGMEFTTTMGYDWVYGDIRTGLYNVNPYGSKLYECDGNFFAWLGPNQGSGRIDFTGATAKSISMPTSTNYGTYVDAYDSSGNLLATDYADPNTGTGTMSEIKVTASSIAYVIVHDTGNYWLIDDLRVRDLLRETNAFQSPTSTNVFQTLETIDMGASSTYQFTNDQMQSLNILLNWKGSRFRIQIIKPDGTIFAETESENPPIRIVVSPAEVGIWKISITAVDVPYDEYPFALDVASVPMPSDVEPPTTALEMIPTFIDAASNMYVSSNTLFNMTATDNLGGSGVASTAYKIRTSASAATYDSGWLPYKGPFYLGGLADGNYFVDYNSTDNAGNIEPTITVVVILDNTPPTTVQTIGDPRYISGGTYVTPDTPFALEATDTGSGVKSIVYRINSTSYDSGWLTYTIPFNLTSLSDGKYTIAFSSTDNVGNVEPSKTVDVTLARAKWLKQDALNQLNSLLPTGNKKVDGKIMVAAGNIKQSLGTAPWIDENHLNPKYGKQVFDKEKEAVLELMEILRGTDATQTVKNKIRTAMDELVRADKEIALIAIFDAKAKGSTDCRVIHEIKEADEEYSEALKAITKGNYDHAVEEFEHAWIRAQHAMKKQFGDVNADGEVNLMDCIIAAKALGSCPGQRNWNPMADLNGDNKVDMRDCIIICANIWNVYN